MERRKLNQSRLNQICYILGSYEFADMYLDFTKNHVYLYMGSGGQLISMFILNEIQSVLDDMFSITHHNSMLVMMFERESLDEILTIPEGLGADNE